MKLTRIAAVGLFLSIAAAGAATGHGAYKATPLYHQVRKLSLPGADGWDYLFVDAGGRKLYISRGTHVQIVDLKTFTLAGDIPDTNGVHGIVVDPKNGHGFTSNGRANAVTIFDTKTLAKIGDVPTGEGPDCIMFDPSTERVFTFNGRSSTFTAIDAKTGTVIATEPLPGRPEFAQPDGKGHIYDNLEDRSEVVEIDAKTLKIMNLWPLAPGDSPSGLAVDGRNRRVFSVCDNQKMVVLDADTGQVLATPTIGNGPDACAFDVKKRLIFSPNGEDGTITEVRETNPDQYDILGTVTTQSGARTIALDTKTDDVYTVTATAVPSPETAPGERRRRTYAPGSFVVLEYAP